MFKKVILACVIAGSMIACNPNHTQYVQQQPMAYDGYQDGVRYVQVQDNSGSMFLMNYMLYSSLMSRGGYNSVVNHYYSHPNDANYRPVTSNFRRGGQISNFSSSYTQTSRANKVYTPPSGVVNKVNATRGSGFKAPTGVLSSSSSRSYSAPSGKVTTSSSSYRPSTYTRPSTSSYRPTTTTRPSTSSYRPSSSYSRPSTSSYRSSSSSSYSRPSSSSYRSSSSSRSYSRH